MLAARDQKVKASTDENPSNRASHHCSKRSTNHQQTNFGMAIENTPSISLACAAKPLHRNNDLNSHQPRCVRSSTLTTLAFSIQHAKPTFHHTRTVRTRFASCVCDVQPRALKQHKKKRGSKILVQGSVLLYVIDRSLRKRHVLPQHEVGAKLRPPLRKCDLLSYVIRTSSLA